MKTHILIPLLAYFILGIIACSQKVLHPLCELKNQEVKEINSIGIISAKKIIEEDCRIDPWVVNNFDGTTKKRVQFGTYNVDSLTFIPISLFKVSAIGNNYTGSNIANFLEWKKNEVIGFYTYRDSNFEGLLDWSGEYHFDLDKECSYFTVQNSELIKTEPYWLGLKYLKENDRDISFLFGVKYFVQTLWFIEEDKIYILDLNEMKIYDPDDFIRSKCYDTFIQDIANGGEIMCNI